MQQPEAQAVTERDENEKQPMVPIAEAPAPAGLDKMFQFENPTEAFELAECQFVICLGWSFVHVAISMPRPSTRWPWSFMYRRIASVASGASSRYVGCRCSY